VHGCKDNSSTTQVTAINDVLNDILFTIYPNPVNDNMLQITTGANAIGQVIEIYDAEGRMVLSAKIRSQKTEMDAANLAGGVYLVKIADAVKKLIKE